MNITFEIDDTKVASLCEGIDRRTKPDVIQGTNKNKITVFCKRTLLETYKMNERIAKDKTTEDDLNKLTI